MQVYTEQHIIQGTDLDCTEKISYGNALCAFINCFTNFNGHINKGNINIRRDYNAFWIVSKYVMYFHRRPVWNEHVTNYFNVYGRQNLKVLSNFYCKKDDELLFEGICEACVLNFGTQKFCALDEIGYPHIDENSNNNNLETLKFTKFVPDNGNEDFAYDKTIRFGDTDMSHHTNNIAYITFLLNAMPSSFYSQHELKRIEIHYLAQSYEGNRLDIYVRDDKEGNILYSACDTEGRTIVKMMAAYA